MITDAKGHRFERRLVLVSLLGLLGWGAISSGAESSALATAGMSGRYRLRLSFGPSCLLPASTATVVVDLTETVVTQGTEVEGGASEAGTAGAAYLALLRKADGIHGAMGCAGGFLGLRTLEGRRVWMQIMADGKTDSSGVRAQGTAFGEVMMSAAEDDSAGTLGSCSARDHSWSLEPF